MEGGSAPSGPGILPGTGGRGDAARADPLEARRVEFVASDDVVASSGSSTTSHVCKVASGANETLRFAMSD